MICVSVGRARHKHMIAEYKHLIEQGFPLVELRLDYIRSDIDLGRLLKDRPGPCVITCRRREEGGRFGGSEDERMTLIRTAIATGVDYIDLEDDIAGGIPRFGATKRIVSYHNFKETPDDLDAVYERLKGLDADVVKICTLANHTSDMMRMIRLQKKATEEGVPTIAFCMGDVGVASRVLAGKYGAPWTYATYSQDRSLAPGQIHCEQLRKLYRYDDINQETKVFGVIADPVGHSMSPLIHNTAMANNKINAVYLPFRVPPEDLEEFYRDANELDLHGLSVTIPHKETTIRNLTQADTSVHDIGACNTVVFDGQERIGYNTDYRAAMMSLEKALGGVGEDGESPLAGLTALVLGAGGVGKAIAFGLVERGAKVVLSDVDAERASDLADRLSCGVAEWELRTGVRADVLVNCTPVGMHPNVDESPMPKSQMHPEMVVFDAVYNPENTLFIKYAKEKECKVVTGVDMFVLQAALQFNLFTGEPAPGKLMREVIKRATSAAKI